MGVTAALSLLLPAILGPPATLPIASPTATPTITLDCTVVDSGFERKSIKLRSHWVPPLKEYRVEVDLDQTGTLPNRGFLELYGKGHRGLYKGWKEEYFEGQNNSQHMLYRVHLWRDNLRGPSAETGKAAISITYLKLPPGGGRGIFDQYLGFCRVDPTLAEEPYSPRFL